MNVIVRLELDRRHVRQTQYLPPDVNPIPDFIEKKTVAVRVDPLHLPHRVVAPQPVTGPHLRPVVEHVVGRDVPRPIPPSMPRPNLVNLSSLVLELRLELHPIEELRTTQEASVLKPLLLAQRVKPELAPVMAPDAVGVSERITLVTHLNYPQPTLHLTRQRRRTRIIGKRTLLGLRQQLRGSLRKLIPPIRLRLDHPVRPALRLHPKQKVDRRPNKIDRNSRDSPILILLQLLRRELVPIVEVFVRRHLPPPVRLVR